MSTSETGSEANQPFDAQAAQLQRDLVEYQQAQADYAEKMAALQLYVQKYGARIDVNHHSKNSPNTEAPNLGTSVPSWYYLDGRGNKIFVQDMTFDNALSLSRGGGGMNVRQAHGHEQQEVVVVVPKAKRNPCWHAEYLRRTEEYEAARRRIPHNSSRVAIPDGHRLIGDGVATSHSQAYGSIGRKQGGAGGGAMWEARQAQARIMGSKSAQHQPRSRPATAGAIMDRRSPAATGGSGYQAPAFLTNSNPQVLAAVMAQQPQQQMQQMQMGGAVSFADQQQQQQYQQPAAAAPQDPAALQAEAQQLLAQLGAAAPPAPQQQ